MKILVRLCVKSTSSVNLLTFLFGYVIGNFLTFKKVAALHGVIFNGFRDIRPGTHHGVFVHLKGEYDLKG